MPYVKSSEGMMTRRSSANGSAGGGHAWGKSSSGRSFSSRRLMRYLIFAANSVRFLTRLSLPQWTLAATLALLVLTAQLLVTDVWPG